MYTKMVKALGYSQWEW